MILCMRYGQVYRLKRGIEEIKCLTNLSALPVDLVLDYNRFVTINMDGTFQSYTLKVLPILNIRILNSFAHFLQ